MYNNCNLIIDANSKDKGDHRAEEREHEKNVDEKNIAEHCDKVEYLEKIVVKVSSEKHEESRNEVEVSNEIVTLKIHDEKSHEIEVANEKNENLNEHIVNIKGNGKIEKNQSEENVESIKMIDDSENSESEEEDVLESDLEASESLQETSSVFTEEIFDENISDSSFDHVKENISTDDDNSSSDSIDSKNLEKMLENTLNRIKAELTEYENSEDEISKKSASESQNVAPDIQEIFQNDSVGYTQNDETKTLKKEEDFFSLDKKDIPSFNNSEKSGEDACNSFDNQMQSKEMNLITTEIQSMLENKTPKKRFSIVASYIEQFEGGNPRQKYRNESKKEYRSLSEDIVKKSKAIDEREVSRPTKNTETLSSLSLADQCLRRARLMHQ